MNKTFTLLLLLSALNVFCQTEIKTIIRPDGITLKYFNPKPVAITSMNEAGLSLYKNVSDNFYTLALTVLFKEKKSTELSGNLIIQTTGKTGISLKPSFHKLVNMNGRDVALSMYYLTNNDVRELKKHSIKLISFSAYGQLVVMNLTQNKNLLITEFQNLK